MKIIIKFSSYIVINIRNEGGFITPINDYNHLQLFRITKLLQRNKMILKYQDTTSKKKLTFRIDTNIIP